MMGKYPETSAGTRSAFRAEALPWIENVRRFAHSLCHNPTDTEDLVQETYLRAHQSWHTFQVGTDCRRWLFTICRNEWRRQRRFARVTMTLGAFEASRAGDDVGVNVSELEPIDGLQGDDELVARLDLRTALDTALTRVPEPYRSTLVLVLLEDQTYEAAAVQLGIPVGTVRSRLSRARQIAQQHLLHVARDAGVLSATQ